MDESINDSVRRNVDITTFAFLTRHEYVSGTTQFARFKTSRLSSRCELATLLIQVADLQGKAQRMQVQGVLFDLFNTLVLLENDDVFYIPSLKKSYDHLVKNRINVSFEDFVRVYFEVRDKLYEETSQTLEDPHFNIRISRTLQSFGYNLEPSHPTIARAGDAFCKEFIKYTHADEDALSMLQQLKGKFKLGIVSNLSIPECVPKLLKKFALNDYFDAVVVSGAINRRKPSPEIFNRALETLGLTANEAVFVGDTPGIDIKGAKAVGLKTVLIERPPPLRGLSSLSYEIPEAYEKVQPDKVIRTLREILAIVQDSERSANETG